MEDKKLTELQYYKWKNSIQDMWLEETRLREAICKHSMMEKDLEIIKYKILLNKENLKTQKILVDDSKTNYEKLRSDLEQELEIELKDCVIDEITFEIKKI